MSKQANTMVPATTFWGVNTGIVALVLFTFGMSMPELEGLRWIWTGCLLLVEVLMLVFTVRAHRGR